MYFRNSECYSDARRGGIFENSNRDDRGGVGWKIFIFFCFYYYYEKNIRINDVVFFLLCSL